MTDHAPATRRKFSSVDDELLYLYDKFLHWFYGRQSLAKARPYAERLETLVDEVYAQQPNIFAEECRSLIADWRGNLKSAIRHREREIELIHRLFALATNPEQRRATEFLFGYDDLADRLDLLALLYQEQGNLAKAREVLHESRALARRHRFPFDGKDILREVEEEVVAKQANGAARRNGVKTRPRSIGADLL